MELSVASGYEQNLPRGYLDKDVQSSEFVQTSVSAGKFFQPRVNTSVVLSAGGSHHLYFNQHGFDYSSLSLGVAIQHKLGMGAYTPRINLSLSAAREDSRGAQRDRDLYGIDLTLSRRLSAGLNFSVGLSSATSRGLDEPAVDFDALPYRQGVTRPTDPMDYRNNSLFAGVDYTLNSGWQLSAGYRYQDGYVVSSAVPPVVDLFIYTEAVALDPAYDHQRLMYLMESRADLWTTAISIPLSRDTAVDIGYNWQNFAVEYVGGYDNSQFLVTLVHQF
ncbi:MAG: hypothetical protein R3F41_14550 [Gammaproteobacteria bacterium]|nr:TonB-dependent receptor [Pseudomonadales bacterium]MCP5347198.1 TonB-dependent receptor [Pseudomonadales bacterium]